MDTKTKKITTMAMLCAISYIVLLISKMFPPMVLFLQYDPKDVVITLGGFIYGPLSAALISVLVSLIEFITISDTGIIGFIMNVISTCGFSCVAAAIYKYRKTQKVAVLSLFLGGLISTVLMLLWNYFITPLYMKVPRADIAAMLMPVFLPFNLIKCGLNIAFTLILYKPIVSGLRRAKLIPPSSYDKGMENRGFLSLSIAIAILILGLCIFTLTVILK